MVKSLIPKALEELLDRTPGLETTPAVDCQMNHEAVVKDPFGESKSLHAVFDTLVDSSPGFVEGPPPPVMLPNQSFSHTFNEAGTFAYFCKVHAYRVGESWVGMMGIVHVVPLTSLDAVNAAASGASAVGYGALGLSIVALLVAVYGVVRGKGPRGSPPSP